MKIFLAWSGDASKALAQFLHKWLPDVIQSLEPFMSEEDIRSGRRWLSEIGKQLTETNFAILCATPGSLESHWMHFEAGAAAKDVEQGQVCALLVDLQLSDLVLPLSQFQNRSATDKDDVLRLLRDLNKGLPEAQRLDPARLDRLFEKNWPDFQAGVAKVRALIRAESEQQPQKTRNSDEILEALLAAQQGSVARLDAIDAQLKQLRIANAVLQTPAAGAAWPPTTAADLPANLRSALGGPANNLSALSGYGRLSNLPSFLTATEGALPSALGDPPAEPRRGRSRVRLRK